MTHAGKSRVLVLMDSITTESQDITEGRRSEISISLFSDTFAGVVKISLVARDSVTGNPRSQCLLTSLISMVWSSLYSAKENVSDHLVRGVPLPGNKNSATQQNWGNQIPMADLINPGNFV